MFKANSIFELEKVIRQRNFTFVICLCLIVTNLIQTMVLYGIKKVTILVPSSLNTVAEISNKGPSAEYVEAFSRDVITLILNISPDNARYANEQILKVTHPAFHGKLKYELETRAENVISKKVATYFSGQSLIVDLKQKQVLISGKLAVLLGKELVSSDNKTYSLSYQDNGFGLLITDFHEVKEEARNDH